MMAFLRDRHGRRDEFMCAGPRAFALGPVCVCATFANTTPHAFAQATIERDPINHSRTLVDDPVARLARRDQMEEVTLASEPAFGYLRSALEPLRISDESQVLVFFNQFIEGLRALPAEGSRHGLDSSGRTKGDYGKKEQFRQWAALFVPSAYDMFSGILMSFGILILEED